MAKGKSLGKNKPNEDKASKPEPLSKQEKKLKKWEAIAKLQR